MEIRISLYFTLFLHLGVLCSTASAQSCEERLDVMTGALKRQVTETESLKRRIVEMEMNRIEEMETLKNRVAETETLKKRVDEMETTLRDLSKHKRLLVSTDENQGVLHKVAFFASLTKSVTLGHMQPVEYDRVLTNVGNGYDSRHGHFTSPVSGTYIFSCSILNTSGHRTTLEIVKNGTQIGIVFAWSSFAEQGSQTMIVHLDKGEMVWVRHFENENSTPQIFGHTAEPYNSFSGALLFDD